MNDPHPQRCRCPECRALDQRWPLDGYQLRLPGTLSIKVRTKEENDDGKRQ